MIRTSVMIVIISLIASVVIGVLIGSMAGGGSDTSPRIASGSPTVHMVTEIASPVGELDDTAVESIGTPGQP